MELASNFILSSKEDLHVVCLDIYICDLLASVSSIENIQWMDTNRVGNGVGLG